MSKSRRRWNADERNQALGQMYASAVWVDGVPSPNFTECAFHSEVAKTTLFRWWRDRDKGLDGTRRNATARARDRAIDRGALSWVSSFDEGLERIAERAVNPEAVEAMSAYEAMRSLKMGIEIKKMIAHELGDKEANDPVSRMSRLRKDCERAALIDAA
jgi:transposase-like protein